MDFTHQPVMLNEVLGFVPHTIKTAIDCTVGGGSHAEAMLKAIPKLSLYGIDRDAEAISQSKKKLAEFTDRVNLIHDSFSNAIDKLQELEVKVDFILADLGVSSKQLDDHHRGFSFRSDGPLDMRMNQDEMTTAGTIVNQSDEKELASIIRKFGEERYAKRIARNIVAFRQKQEFTTTLQLAECVEQAVPLKYRHGRIHPATRTFQALRIEVNHEIEELEALLEGSIRLLNSGGRIAIITFHSLEDRPVKQIFRKWVQPCQCPTGLPQCVCGLEPLARLLNKKVITAKTEEKELNPRSRSAKLRVAEKL